VLKYSYKINFMKFLLEYLQKIQNKNGFISESDILEASKQFQLSPAEIFETISSYEKFNLWTTSEKVIKICDSPICHSKGGENLIKLAEKLLNTKIGTYNKKFIIESCQCLGECDKGPVMTINDELFTNLNEEKLKQIFKDQKLI